MTSETLSATVAIVLSLALAYLPFLNTWYVALPNPQKVTVTGILLVLVAAGTLAYNCAGVLACITTDWPLALSTLIAALVANQSTYLLFVRPFRVTS